VGGEVQARSLGGIILNGPLTSRDNGLRAGYFFQVRWGVSSKCLNVDVYFSLGLGGVSLGGGSSNMAFFCLP
jgi:hypothetical protein